MKECTNLILIFLVSLQMCGQGADFRLKGVFLDDANIAEFRRDCVKETNPAILAWVDTLIEFRYYQKGKVNVFIHSKEKLDENKWCSVNVIDFCPDSSKKVYTAVWIFYINEVDYVFETTLLYENKDLETNLGLVQSFISNQGVAVSSYFKRVRSDSIANQLTFLKIFELDDRGKLNTFLPWGHPIWLDDTLGVFGLKENAKLNVDFKLRYPLRELVKHSSAKKNDLFRFNDKEEYLLTSFYLKDSASYFLTVFDLDDKLLIRIKKGGISSFHTSKVLGEFYLNPPNSNHLTITVKSKKKARELRLYSDRKVVYKCVLD